MRVLSSPLPFLVVALAFLPEGGGAQAASLAATCPRIPVPFGVGEVATYEVKFGVFSVGEGRLSVAALDTIRGRPAYRLELDLEAGISFPPVRARYDWKSWMDTESLVSRRHTRDYVEAGTPRKRFYEIFPEERRWEQTDADARGATAHPCPQDDISLIYFMRALSLSPGDTFEGNRYFKEEGNPVKVEVVRRDTTEVPAGRFGVIVMRPTIQTKGLFSEGGQAEVHISDDKNRDIVYMKMEVPIVPAAVTLHLKEIRRGTPAGRP